MTFQQDEESTRTKACTLRLAKHQNQFGIEVDTKARPQIVCGIINSQSGANRTNTTAKIQDLIRLVKGEGKTGLHLSVAVLKHSNATPFDRRRGQTFRCFFNCYENFDATALREHARSKHAAHLFRAAKGVPKTTLRVDIADLRCTVCKRQIPDLETLESHFNNTHGISTYRDTADVLVPYKLTEGEYQCQLCGDKCDDFIAIDAHMESHFPLNICEVCGRGFMSVRRLQMHRLEHMEKKFACETCQASFVSEYFKKRHEDYVHKGIGNLICPKCPDLRFKDHYVKLDHMEQVHNQEKRPTPTCEHCGKVYKHPNSLTVHIKTVHLGVKLRNCYICPKRFADNRELEMHVMSVHAGDRLTCVYCDSRFRYMKNLAQHMRKAHEGLERRCLCPVCGKPCENRCKLKQHMAEVHRVQEA